MALARLTVHRSILAATAATALLLAVGPTGAVQEAPPIGDPAGGLLRQIDDLTKENAQLRAELAKERLERERFMREAAELRQFIDDHDQYGQDFLRYAQVRDIQEREMKLRLAEQRRQEREAERAARKAEQAQIAAERARERAEKQRLDRYRSAGFESIGLDVFTSRMAFSYPSSTTPTTRVDYDPLIGRYLRPGGVVEEVNYRSMTISGSVLSASTNVRNVGVAITFFDGQGNQVGGDIIQVNNARPDVPYPFTSTLEMALNEPFATWSAHVVYADAIRTAPAPVPAPQPVPPAPAPGTPATQPGTGTTGG